MPGARRAVGPAVRVMRRLGEVDRKLARKFGFPYKVGRHAAGFICGTALCDPVGSKVRTAATAAISAATGLVSSLRRKRRRKPRPAAKRATPVMASRRSR